MLRSRKYKRTNTPNQKHSPLKTNNQDSSASQNKTSNRDNTNNNSTYEINHKQSYNKNIHIPDYFIDDNNSPITWFNTTISIAHLENIYNEYDICSAIVTKLPTKILKQISEEIEKLERTKNPLESLKRALCEKFTSTNRNILNDCIEDTQLGDRKPSELYKTLKRKLNQIEENSEITRTFFLRALPSNIRVQLATTTTNSGEELAAIADKIHAETNLEVNHIHSKNKNGINENQNILTEINKQLENVNTQFKTLEKRLNNLELASKKTNNNQRTTDRRTNANATTNQNKIGLCWYHENYGNKAYRCQSPCNFNNLNTNSHYPQHQG